MSEISTTTPQILELDEKIARVRYDFKRRNSNLSFADYQEQLKSLAIEQVRTSLEKSEMHVMTDLRTSQNIQTVKDHVVGSAVLQFKTQISENIPASTLSTLKRLVFYIAPILINISVVLSFYFEYF